MNPNTNDNLVGREDHLLEEFHCEIELKKRKELFCADSKNLGGVADDC